MTKEQTLQGQAEKWLAEYNVIQDEICARRFSYDTLEEELAESRRFDERIASGERLMKLLESRPDLKNLWKWIRVCVGVNQLYRRSLWDKETAKRRYFVPFIKKP